MIKKLFVFILLISLNYSLSAQEKEQDSIAQTKEQDSITYTENITRLTKRQKRRMKKDSIEAVEAMDTVKLSGKERRKARFFEKVIQKKEVDALAPSKAAFYSAILPGLGQIYNKRYWKLPIVYGALGAGVYFYIDNNNNYNRYRTAYKSRLAGFVNDEFYDLDGSGIVPGTPDVSDKALRDAQNFYQGQRDLALLLTVAMYVLNIVDANVDAHLRQFNISEDLSLNPVIYQNPINYNNSVGFSLTYKF